MAVAIVALPEVSAAQPSGASFLDRPRAGRDNHGDRLPRPHRAVPHGGARTLSRREHRVDEELHRHFNEKFDVFAAFVSGRVTYEMMAEFWPTANTNPESTSAMVEFAHIWRDKPKSAAPPLRRPHRRVPRERHARRDRG